MGKKAEASNNICETWSRLLTEQPAPANCPCFCLDNSQEKTTVQNHHEAKVQRCESPTPLTWKEDGNVTSTGYKEKEITSPRDVTHYELTELYELISSPAEQRSVSALLSSKISTGTEPVPWDKCAKMSWPWLRAGCSAAALGKEWIPPALALWHHHTQTSSETENYTSYGGLVLFLPTGQRKSHVWEAPCPFISGKVLPNPREHFLTCYTESH